MAEPSSELRPPLLAVFRDEAEEHLSALQAALLVLERGVSGDERRRLVDETLRVAHTFKGAARAVGLESVEGRCQAIEALLHALARGAAEGDRAHAADLRREVNELTRLLARALAPPGGAADPGDSRVAGETVRVTTESLDRLIIQTDVLTGTKLALEERVREVEALARALAPERVTAAVHASVRALLVQLRSDQRGLARTVEDLGDELRRVRLMPAAGVLELFPRMAADLAAAQGKEVECTVTGAEFDVDRQVLEAVKDPLIHLVRNAIDHGIEPPDARRQAGKPARGRVAVHLEPREARRLTITVEDDGAGIRLDGVRQAAARAGIISAEDARALTDDAVLELVYRSGVSTSAEVSRLSGHGVGLAIVRERVERLGGEVRTRTRAGAGTTITLRLPATIASFRGLLVQAGGQPFLLASDHVGRVLAVRRERVRTLDGRDVVPWEGRALPLVSLSALLGVAEAAPEAVSRPCVVVVAGDDRLGLLVDAILGEREVLVKRLGAPLLRVRHVAAAALLGSGELALVLRPTDLVSAGRAGVRAAPVPAPAHAPRRSRILVVDDSITTRVMERNLLEAAGYDVRVAVDGLEAWTALRTEPFDLVVADVDMPRLDGFALTARIRDDRDLQDLPVILVTALESPEDRAQGARVGANAYIGKSAFDQTSLLDVVERLL